MERRGFIHDILDVKLLILYVMGLVEEPISAQTIYELCLQDECLSYFDVQEAVPQLVETGHLAADAVGHYTITDKGRETVEIADDDIAFPLKQRAKAAVDVFNQENKRDQFVQTELQKEADGTYIVRMCMDDPGGRVMTLELTAPNVQQARKLASAYQRNAETVYQSLMLSLLEKMEGDDTENS